jgi:hypothetical protein
MHNALLCKENLERSKPAWRSQLGIPTIPSAGLRILTTWPNSAQVLASPRGLPLLFSAMWVEEPGTNCRGDTKVPGHHAMLLWDLSPGEHPRKRSKADILTCFESNKGGLSSWFALYASSCVSGIPCFTYMLVYRSTMTCDLETRLMCSDFKFSGTTR